MEVWKIAAEKDKGNRAFLLISRFNVIINIEGKNKLKKIKLTS